MGADQSKPLSEWTADDVALNVASLGDQYAKYGPAIREHQVDGNTLAELNSASDIEELMGKLAITSRLHWRVLGKKLAVLRGDEPMSPAAKPMTRRISTSGTPPSVLTARGPAFGRSATVPVPQPSPRDDLLRKMQEASEREQKEHEELVKREKMLRSQIATLKA